MQRNATRYVALPIVWMEKIDQWLIGKQPKVSRPNRRLTHHDAK